MKQMPLGKTGLSVSVLALGCMYLGTRTDAETSTQLLDQYFEAGGRFLDTSNNYPFWITGTTGGESERFLGQWMKARGHRDQIFLATKVGARPLRNGAGFADSEGLSAAVIERAVDDSLRRLNTDVIDLYYAHIDHRATPLEETLGAFDRIVKAGKVRQIGCSNFTAWRVAEARSISRTLKLAEYVCVQQNHTYLRPRPSVTYAVDHATPAWGIEVRVDAELRDYCETHDDFSIIAYTPLLTGAYAGKPLPSEYVGADTDARLKALAQVAAEVGATPNQVVLAWLMQDTPQSIPLFGASTTAQLQESLGALEVHLTDAQMATLNKAGA